ncbi:MAG: hypothetical protein Q9191_006254 [Dirinaria sp. TL-2023a]
MRPSRSLPLSPGWADEEFYIESLLHFVTTNELFQKLCGGVHILDFFTRDPDLYSALLPEDWRTWLQSHELPDILDLLLRENMNQFRKQCDDHYIPDEGRMSSSKSSSERLGGWRGTERPPESLVKYICDVRRYSLERGFKPPLTTNEIKCGQAKLPQHVAVGMKPKKIHEVAHFVRYIDDLTSYNASSPDHHISHIVDFGSGQNYLGRALATPPCCKDVVAIESKQHNIEGARAMDVSAKLTIKKKIMRNKKAFRAGEASACDAASPLIHVTSNAVGHSNAMFDLNERHGSIEYFEKVLQDGDLSALVPCIRDRRHTVEGSREPQLMVVSLHSCGNLLHHGLRSLILNPSVKAVAMVGCCYNLMTERLGPATYKIPSLRLPNERLDTSATACDPHGYPMSERVATYKHRYGEGVRLNITARMMAVQAPSNWTTQDSEGFFTRHFFRALLQRIFVDHGVLGKPSTDAESAVPSNTSNLDGARETIIIGSLRKSCYISFTAYVRGALSKLRNDPFHGEAIAKLDSELSDEAIDDYADAYKDRRKELSIVWSLMAFSASVVESAIVVDRWLYLKEQQEVSDCWVEAVFDYEQSPRNLVIVGIKT